MNIARAREAAERLARLLSDPQPGLHTWLMAVDAVKKQLDKEMEQ